MTPCWTLDNIYLLWHCGISWYTCFAHLQSFWPVEHTEVQREMTSLLILCVVRDFSGEARKIAKLDCQHHNKFTDVGERQKLEFHRRIIIHCMRTMDIFRQLNKPPSIHCLQPLFLSRTHADSLAPASHLSVFLDCAGKTENWGVNHTTMWNKHRSLRQRLERWP